MAFIEIGFNTKRPLILGRGGFGTQLNDWLMDEGWGSADFLDDNAPDAVGGLRDYVDPAILKRGRPAFVALGDRVGPISLLDTPGIRKANRRTDKIAPDSLAAQVTSENPLAAQYAETILGRIVCCDTPDTLEQYPNLSLIHI